MADPPAVSPHTAAAHVFVESVAEPVLDDADRHHLERVLRLRPGTAITVGDGAGHWRPVGLGTDLEPLGPVVAEPAATPRLTVAFAIVKGDRPELMARALTEVGVDRLVPMAKATVSRGEAAASATTGPSGSISAPKPTGRQRPAPSPTVIAVPGRRRSTRSRW